MTYIEPDLIDDEGAVAEASLAGIADRIDGWEPSEGHIETVIAESMAVAIATAVTVLKDQALDAYTGFGQRVLGIAKGAAGVATALSTWNFDSSDEVTIEAGAEVKLTLPGGDPATFVVTEDVIKPVGTTSQTGVGLVAVESGPDVNGATNPATTNFIGSDNVSVVSVTITTPASGGADEEDRDAYADRLADRARRMHTIPITPADHAAFATDVTGVARAVALNRVDPSDPGEDAPGHITLVAVDDNGDALAAPVKVALIAYFDAIDRPLNTILHVEDPQQVDLDFTLTVKAAPSVTDPGELQSRVDFALIDYFNRANFDADTTEPGGWSPSRSTQVTIFDVAAAIDDLEGVQAVEAVTINGGTAPVALPAPVSLPNLQTIVTTVTT